MPRLSQNRDLPDAVRQLRLCSALQICGKIGVENAFDKSNDQNLYVYDDEELGYSDWTNVAPVVSLSETFQAHNPKQNTLVLLPLDGRIITGPHCRVGGVCDCALLTDKELSFVEFKTNAMSPNDLTLLQRAEEAKDQLWHTYDGIIRPQCRNVCIDITQKVNIDFYIVFDHDLNVTDARADFQDLRTAFLQEKHYPLFVENSKQFK